MVRLGSPQEAQAMPKRSDGVTEMAALSRETEYDTSTRGRVMSVPLCLCGTPLVTDVEMGIWMCAHCGRAFCRDCGGMMARVGGCDTCTVCGMGMCG